mmetsp:Transcript_145952/g.254673  ORF Transcript_145952/g.254673 Transcript_145952/m.254673 type:complete len:104 (+) Transcript_145952:851-1162(+)
MAAFESQGAHFDAEEIRTNSQASSGPPVREAQQPPFFEAGGTRFRSLQVKHCPSAHCKVLQPSLQGWLAVEDSEAEACCTDYKPEVCSEVWMDSRAGSAVAAA